MNDSYNALLRLLPFPAVYAATPPIPSPVLAKLLSQEECDILFSDPAHIPGHLAIGGTIYKITPSPENPALFFLTPENPGPTSDVLQQFLTDIASPLSNLVLMGSLLGRSEIPKCTTPYIQQMRRITDQIVRLHYNATPHSGSFSCENITELIRDTLGYASFYLPQLSVSYDVEGDADSILYLSKMHVEGLILNLLSEVLSLADSSVPPAFRFTLRLKDSPCLVAQVNAPSVSYDKIETLLFSASELNSGFLFIREACVVHGGVLFLRREGDDGFALTITFPQREDIPHTVTNFTSTYSGYEQARMLLSNHLALSCYENVKR